MHRFMVFSFWFTKLKIIELFQNTADSRVEWTVSTELNVRKMISSFWVGDAFPLCRSLAMFFRVCVVPLPGILCVVDQR